MSCGVAPIISDSLVDYSKLVKAEGVGIIFDGDLDALVENVRSFNMTSTDINGCYIRYFNPEVYEMQYELLLK